MSTPFEIVSLAAAIAQFLDIGFRLIQEAKDIYDSGRKVQQDVEELRMVVQEIKILNQETRPLSNNDFAIRNLAERCETLANALLDLLRSLETRQNAKSRMLDSVRVSFTTFMRRKDILKLWERLNLVENQLRKRIAHATQREQHSSILLLLNNIRYENENAGHQVSDKLDKLQESVALATACSVPDGKYQIALPDISENLMSLVQECRLIDHRQSVIKSLSFKTMKKRHDQIDTAHFKTLGWVFDRSTTTLVQWLEEQSGIYWVNGQAGSGKSTLMKFICDHGRTTDALARWAGHRQLFVASFYFWNAGVEMQKSQLGLLQSILYQILRHDPSLVANVCPDHEDSEPWDLAQLNAAFARLVYAAPSANFCFFIDGLDEYGGSELEIIGVLKTLVQSKRIKICASSRPWVAFESELSDPNWMFVLQDFTKKDMENYIESMLVENATFQEVAAKDHRCHNLVEQIAERANGVWLWVFLVVRDLLKDISTGETYHTLELRLRSLPQELNKYFTRILNNIDPFFKSDTARIFLIAVESARPVPLLAISFLENESIDQNYALNAEVKEMTEVEVSAMCDDWRPKLQARCGDLLVVRTDDSEDMFSKQAVDVLHRTVRDFLRDNHQTALHSQVPGDFCCKKTLCRMLLMLLKKCPVKNFRQACNSLFVLIDEFLYYAYELEQMDQAASQFALLDEIDRVMSFLARNERVHWTNGRDPPTDTTYVRWIERGQCSYLGLAIQARLRFYVEHVLDRSLAHMKKSGRPLLDYALRPTRVTPGDLPYYREREVAEIEIDLVAALLARGADPNECIHIYGDQTVWQLYVLFIYQKYAKAHHDNQLLFDTTCLLVEHNADLDQMVNFPSWETHLGTTARYKTQVSIERHKASAREVIERIFNSNQMITLDNKLIQARLQARIQEGWLEWMTRLLMGNAS